MSMWVDDLKCMACGMCSDECPEEAVSFVGTGKYRGAFIDSNKCMDCGKCKQVCPADAISSSE